MKIYLASRFRNKEKIRVLKSELNCCGHQALCSWLDENPANTKEENARRDLQEIDEADALLLFTEDCELVPGGMHVEFGYALAKGKKLFLLGPPVNIFNYLSEVVILKSLNDI